MKALSLTIKCEGAKCVREINKTVYIPEAWKVEDIEAKGICEFCQPDKEEA